jgi:Tubulin like
MNVTTTFPRPQKSRWSVEGALAAPSHPSEHDRKRETVVLLLGGSGVKASPLIRALAPEVGGAILEIDTAAGPETAQDRLILSADGREYEILRNKGRFPLIGGDPLFEGLTSDDLASTGPGSGQVRAYTTLLLAPQVEVFKRRILQTVEAARRGLQGPGTPKHLIVEIVASLAGGAGSALILYSAILVRDVVRAIDSSIGVTVRVHVLAPGVFAPLAIRPDQAERNYSNAGAALVELARCQASAFRGPVGRSLGVTSNDGWLVDSVVLYDATDSSSLPSDIDRIVERIAANVRGAASQTIGDLEAQHDTNRCAAARRADGRPEICVLDSTQTAIAEFPVGWVRERYAVGEQEQLVAALLQPADTKRVERLCDAHAPALATHGLDRQIAEAFAKFARRARIDPKAFAKHDSATARSELRRLREGFASDTLRQVDTQKESLSRQLREEIVPRRVGTCVNRLIAGAQGLGELRGALDRLGQSAEAEARGRRAALEGGARENTVAAIDEACAAFEDAGLLRRGAAQAHAVEAFNAYVEAEVDRQCSEVIAEYQELMAGMLFGFAERVGLVAARLEEVRGPLAARCASLDGLVARQGRFHRSVLSADELAPFLGRLAASIRAAYGDAPGLSIGELLNAGVVEAKIDELLDAVRDDRIRRFGQHLAGVRDLTGLIEAYQLRFRADAWLGEQLRDLSLPSRPNTVVGNVGGNPEQFIVAAAGRDHGLARAVLDGRRGVRHIDLVESDLAFCLVVRRRLAGLPLDAAPNWHDCMAALLASEGATGVRSPYLSGRVWDAGSDPMVKAFAETEATRPAPRVAISGDRLNGNHQLTHVGDTQE